MKCYFEWTKREEKSRKLRIKTAWFIEILTTTTNNWNIVPSFHQWECSYFRHEKKNNYLFAYVVRYNGKQIKFMTAKANCFVIFCWRYANANIFRLSWTYFESKWHNYVSIFIFTLSCKNIASKSSLSSFAETSNLIIGGKLILFLGLRKRKINRSISRQSFF